jgi:hypothetical protein
MVPQRAKEPGPTVAAARRVAEASRCLLLAGGLPRSFGASPARREDAKPSTNEIRHLLGELVAGSHQAALAEEVDQLKADA